MFKYNVFFIIIFLCFGSVNGQGIEFFEGTWEEVLAEAEKENKEIFVDIYTTWCGPCKRLDQTTFQDPILGKYMNENFVSVKVEAEHGKHRSLAYGFQIGGYPVMIFLDKNGIQKIQARGFKKEDVLLSLAKYAKYNMKIDGNISSLVTTSVEDLNKEQLTELLYSFNEFHSNQKNQCLERLHDLLSNEEREVLKYDFLSHYPFLTEDLKAYYIDIYTHPSLYDQNRKQIIEMRYNVGKEVEFEYTLAFSGKDKEAFKRVLDRRMNYAVKTGQVDQDERAILEEGYIEEYDYKQAGGQF